MTQSAQEILDRLRESERMLNHIECKDGGSTVNEYRAVMLHSQQAIIAALMKLITATHIIPPTK